MLSPASSTAEPAPESQAASAKGLARSTSKLTSTPRWSRICGQRSGKAGYSLAETMLAVAVCAVGFTLLAALLLRIGAKEHQVTRAFIVAIFIQNLFLHSVLTAAVRRLPNSPPSAETSNGSQNS